MSDTRIRIFLIGSCDGFHPLRDQLAAHPELELIGETDHVGQAAAVLAGGHLDCVLLATRESTFPAAEIAAVREHTRAPLIMVASGGKIGRTRRNLEAFLEMKSWLNKLPARHIVGSQGRSVNGNLSQVLRLALGIRK